MESQQITYRDYLSKLRYDRMEISEAVFIRKLSTPSAKSNHLAKEVDILKTDAIEAATLLQISRMSSRNFSTVSIRKCEAGRSVEK